MTGSSSGIGQAIAVKLAQAGASLVINYAGRGEGAEETLKHVEAAGARGIVVKADVSKVAELQTLIDSRLGGFWLGRHPREQRRDGKEG